jgi:uncharacterized protein (DUF1697 family)
MNCPYTFTNRFIALFRGINVGEKNRLTMQDLTALLARLGCENIRTYIQSGNVVLDHAAADAGALAAAIKVELRSSLNVDSEVLLLTVPALKAAMDNNPYANLNVDASTIHLGFLAARPLLANLDTLANIKAPSEQYHLTGEVFYLYAPDGVGRSKLAANAERLLGVPMTDRNWRTVCKLWEMAQ